MSSFPAPPRAVASDLSRKLHKLRRILAELESVAVAFSGGVDSTFLLKVASDVLGPRAVAVIADSPSLPRRELADARRLVKEIIGARVIEVHTSEMEHQPYRANGPDRCFHCKSALMDEALRIAHELDLRYVILGTNATDRSDYRPGQRASTQRGARHPLLEAGLEKAEIRALSHALGLPTWDKAEMACLASRIPYGQVVTPEKLAMVESLEDALLGLGFLQVRVRHHDDVARIEVPPRDIARLATAEVRDQVVAAAKGAGFVYVSVDLQGYRRGALNEVLAHPAVSSDADSE